MDDSDSPMERFRENIVGITSVLVTGIWMGAMFTGQDWWLAALLVGYVAVVPIVSMLFGDEEDVEEWWDGNERSESETDENRASAGGGGGGEDAESTDAALQALRERYASGELTEAQFERKLERLLEVETVEDLERAGKRRTDEATESAASTGESIDSGDENLEEEREQVR